MLSRKVNRFPCSDRGYWSASLPGPALLAPHCVRSVLTTQIYRHVAGRAGAPGDPEPALPGHSSSGHWQGPSLEVAETRPRTGCWGQQQVREL